MFYLIPEKPDENFLISILIFYLVILLFHFSQQQI
jgi:hypothetical protein